MPSEQITSVTGTFLLSTPEYGCRLGDCVSLDTIDLNSSCDDIADKSITSLIGRHTDQAVVHVRYRKLVFIV